MAGIIKCPVCGESNLADQEFCQYCQSRLEPLTGALKGADAAIKPGQIPTKKNTAELEPILPQWLRDARDSARKSAEADAVQASQQPQESYSASSTPDLLAGLQSQSGSDEEEVPDWLTNITGTTPKPKKPQAESSEVRWVEVGGAKDFAQEEPDEAAPYTPSWLQGLTPTESQPPEKDELSDWFRQADDSQKPQQSGSQAPAFDTSFSASSDGNDTPDWLQQMAADSAQNDNSLFNDSSSSKTFTPAPSDTPDWLRQMAAEDGAQKNDLGATPSDTPDWLRQMAAEDGAQKSDLNATPSDAPDWLHQMAVEDGAQNDNAPFLAGEPVSPASAETDDTPDWLRAMGGNSYDQAQGADSAVFSETGFGESPAEIPSEASKDSSSHHIPEWMNDFSSQNEEPAPGVTPSWLKEDAPVAATGADAPSWLSDTPEEQAPAQEAAGFGDIPSWLKAAAPQSSVFENSSAEPASATSPASDAPDWLNAFKSIETPAPQTSSAFSSDTPFESAPPAFTADSQAGQNMDELFADMPDWLSNATDAPPSTNPTPITNSDLIAPGELPSWVQAMRPADSGLSSSSSSSISGDRTLESRGALAGLMGVLPSMPGYAPTSKPKAYSIKLQASEEQLAHATLLEQILTAETAPVPIGSFSALTNSRNLRWFLSAALFIVLTTVLFMHTLIFPMPVGVPREINDALQVSQSIPEGAPVLVAFDYEPARAGEMEAAAAPMFNLLRQPNLTFISTNETGAILAERFVSGPLADTDKSGVQYLNLGYLPGGQMGIRTFAPSLSQYMALIIITDSADSARSWIEQISSMHSAIPIVIISSAQATPMIQPYYESQQIKGLVGGLYGGAVFEQSNGGIPGVTRTYWDAYSIGMLLAVILIAGGGLWNFVLSLNARAAGEAQ